VIRIYPGLWVSTVLLVLLAGMFFSPLGPLAFWMRYDTLDYLAHNMTMLPHFGWQDSLPFALDAKDSSFNWSLWTLPLELKMYMLLTLVGVFGGLRGPLAVAALAGVGVVGQILYRVFGDQLLPHDTTRFMFFFFAGAMTYFCRDRVTPRIRGLLVCLAIPVAAIALGGSTLVRQAAVALTLPYLVLWFAYVPQGRIRLWNRVGDFSYGTYIYAFPVQLVLSRTAVGARPLANFALTMLVVVPIAALSWYGIERRALRMPAPAALERLMGAMLRRLHKLRPWSPGDP
jgi:peptidoglycan/LPS O-acetylase OafA/YrhL